MGQRKVSKESIPVGLPPHLLSKTISSPSKLAANRQGLQPRSEHSPSWVFTPKSTSWTIPSGSTTTTASKTSAIGCLTTAHNTAAYEGTPAPSSVLNSTPFITPTRREPIEDEETIVASKKFTTLLNSLANQLLPQQTSSIPYHHTPLITEYDPSSHPPRTLPTPISNQICCPLNGRSTRRSFPKRFDKVHHP